VDPSEAYGAQHVLVTGAAGFIGSHLVDGLVAAGARVTALDDLSAGRRENLAQSLDRIRFVEGSVLDAGLLARLLDGVDAVFHLAANASVPRSSEDPRHDFTANVEGTFRLLDAVRGHGRPRIVFASSAAVYGDGSFWAMFATVLAAFIPTQLPLGIAEGDMVRVTSVIGSLEVRARLWEGVQPGTVAKCFGQGHWAYGRVASKDFAGFVPRGANFNEIMPDDYDRLTGSTAPRDPGRLWEFNMAFWGLPKEQQAYVL